MELLKKGIIESMPFPMWVFDNATLRFLDVNDYATTRYGYSREEFLNMSLENIRPKSDVERLLNHLLRKNEEKRSGPTLWRHQSKSGEIFWVKVRCQRFKHHQKPCTAVLIEEETQQVFKFGHLTDEEQLSFIIENSLDIFAVLDFRANFIFATKSLEQCTGIPLASLMGACAFDRIKEEDKQAVKETFQKTLEEPFVAQKVSFRYLGADNQYRHFEAIGRAVTNIPELHGISLQARDVTERVMAEDSLKIQNQKLKSIAWHQSHTVRAPLANIMGLVHLMQQEQIKQDEMEDYLAMLNSSTIKLDEAIHSLTKLI